MGLPAFFLSITGRAKRVIFLSHWFIAVSFPAFSFTHFFFSLLFQREGNGPDRPPYPFGRGAHFVECRYPASKPVRLLCYKLDGPDKPTARPCRSNQTKRRRFSLQVGDRGLRDSHANFRSPWVAAGPENTKARLLGRGLFTL